MQHAYGRPDVAIIQRAAIWGAIDVAHFAWQMGHCEWGGIAWGRLLQTDDGGLAVWIAAMTPGVGSASAVDFEMDPQSYVIGLGMLRQAGFPDGIEEVGLWHTHPGYGIFLSAVDEDYFGLIHPEAWKVSIVVDQIRNEYGVFVKSTGGVQMITTFIYSGDELGTAPHLGCDRSFWTWKKEVGR